MDTQGRILAVFKAGKYFCTGKDIFSRADRHGGLVPMAMARKLKPSKRNRKGTYWTCTLIDLEGKFIRASVHRVIWLYWNGRIPDKMTINHVDGNKDNNLLSNLEVVTASENSLHSFRIGTQRSRDMRGSKNPNWKGGRSGAKDIKF